jgi:hypothetical protein
VSRDTIYVAQRSAPIARDTGWSGTTPEQRVAQSRELPKERTLAVDARTGTRMDTLAWKSAGYFRTDWGSRRKSGFQAQDASVGFAHTPAAAKMHRIRHLVGEAQVVELAITHGAEIASVPFLDVLLTGDRAIVPSFLERGADPIADYPFARAFHQLRAKTTIGSYLDCRRSRPDLAEGLQRQADTALRQFAQEGNLKWVSPLMWAGADPRSRGPTVEDNDDSEWSTTALYEACESRNVDVLKRLRPGATTSLACWSGRHIARRKGARTPPCAGCESQ